jgi:hypothetical protein
MPDHPMTTYLNDHLAGATAGCDLVARMRDNNKGTEAGAVLAKVAEEIEADRDVLERIMHRLDVDPSTLKQMVGWTAERLSRLRLHERISGSADLSRMLECEMLSSGIESKRLMWVALDEVKERDPRLGAFDFDELTRRAEAQRTDVERVRIDAATKALAAAS